MRLLRSFMVVADTGVFRAAAETVGRSQSTSDSRSQRWRPDRQGPLTRRKGRCARTTSEGASSCNTPRAVDSSRRGHASRSDECLPASFGAAFRFDFFGRDSRRGWRDSRTSIRWSGWQCEAKPIGRNLTERCAPRRIRPCILQTGDRCKDQGTVAAQQLVWVSGPNIRRYCRGIPAADPAFPEAAPSAVAIAALKNYKTGVASQCRQSSFECLKSGSHEGMGITVWRRAVAPRARGSRHG